LSYTIKEIGLIQRNTLIIQVDLTKDRINHEHDSFFTVWVKINKYIKNKNLLVVNNTLLRLTKLRTIELPHFNVKKVLLAILEGSQMKLKPLLCI